MDVGVPVVGGEIMVVVDRDWLGQVTAREAEVLAGIRRHRTNAQLAEDLAAHRNGRLSNQSRVIASTSISRRRG